MGTELVAKKLGIKYRTLDYWIRTGVLDVTKPANGVGSARGWSIGDCVRAQAVKWLRQFVSLQTIRDRGIVSEIADQAIRSGKLLVFDASTGSMSVMSKDELADIESYSMPGHTRLTLALEAAADYWRNQR